MEDRKFPKHRVDELIRLALIYAIQDREGMAEADPLGAGPEAADLALQMEAYLLKRYGQETMQRKSSRIPSVSIFDL